MTAVHGIDLTVQDGEMLVLVGPSACGKSTLLRIIAGVDSITTGTIAIVTRECVKERFRNTYLASFGAYRDDDGAFNLVEYDVSDSENLNKRRAQVGF